MSLALQGFEEANLEKLRSAIQLARRVFEEWGLVDAAMAKTMAELEAKGALATKPTGSGLGGYVLALWDPSIDRSQIENAIVAL
ncbi:MAG: hypothetical protein RMK80_04590 [Pseudobdellovibrionaceae bacterium]|nr:hypothetical protein [Pseudobdellovibrionaceae bacterium]